MTDAARLIWSRCSKLRQQVCTARLVVWVVDVVVCGAAEWLQMSDGWLQMSELFDADGVALSTGHKCHSCAGLGVFCVVIRSQRRVLRVTDAGRLIWCKCRANSNFWPCGGIPPRNPL